MPWCGLTMFCRGLLISLAAHWPCFGVQQPWEQLCRLLPSSHPRLLWLRKPVGRNSSFWPSLLLKHSPRHNWLLPSAAGIFLLENIPWTTPGIKGPEQAPQKMPAKTSARASRSDMAGNVPARGNHLLPEAAAWTGVWPHCSRLQAGAATAATCRGLQHVRAAL